MEIRHSWRVVFEMHLPRRIQNKAYASLKACFSHAPEIGFWYYWCNDWWHAHVFQSWCFIINWPGSATTDKNSRTKSKRSVEKCTLYKCLRAWACACMACVPWVPYNIRFFQEERRANKTYHNKNCADSYELPYTGLGQSCERGGEVMCLVPPEMLFDLICCCYTYHYK